MLLNFRSNFQDKRASRNARRISMKQRTSARRNRAPERNAATLICLNEPSCREQAARFMGAMHRSTRYAISEIIQYRICDPDIPFTPTTCTWTTQIADRTSVTVNSGISSAGICTSHLAARFPAEAAKNLVCKLIEACDRKINRFLSFGANVRSKCHVRTILSDRSIESEMLMY